MSIAVLFATHSTLTPYLAVPLVVIALTVSVLRRRSGRGGSGGPN